MIHTVGPGVDATPRTAPRCWLLLPGVAAGGRRAGRPSVAFPAISAGVYGWPLDDAARIAVETVRGDATEVRLVRFVLFDEAAYRAFRAAA